MAETLAGYEPLVADAPDILYIPPPKNSAVCVDTVAELAREASERLIVFDNIVVHAIVGNARQPVQEAIRLVKGERRGLKQPVGCTMPFDDPFLLNVFDAKSITKDKKIPALYADPEVQEERLGGIAFLRGPIKDDVSHVPDCMLSEKPRKDGSGNDRLLQAWSPAGNPGAEMLLREMIKQGAWPVMSSANVSGQAEIVDRIAAKTFARRRGLAYAAINPAPHQPLRPWGSTPITEARFNENKLRWEMVWTRTGCFGPALLLRLFPDLPVQIDEARKQPDPKYPDKILQLEDIQSMRPRHLRMRTPKGADLRKYILEAAGCSV